MHRFYHYVFIMTSHHERHGLRYRVCSLIERDRTVQENHCLIGQALKTVGRYKTYGFGSGDISKIWKSRQETLQQQRRSLATPFPARFGWWADGWDLVPLVKGFHLDKWPFGLRHRRNTVVGTGTAGMRWLGNVAF